LVGAPDADILAAAIEILRKRIAAGTATFLVKVKAHRGEPANEGADILSDNAIPDPKAGKEWCQRTNRAVFTWRKPCREAEKGLHHALIRFLISLLVCAVLYVVTFTQLFISSPECAHLSTNTCKLLFVFLHLILCCPSPYCIPHAIIECRMMIMII